MRKSYVFILFFSSLFLALSGQVWAQLKCSDCIVTLTSFTPTPIPEIDGWVTIPVTGSNNTFTGTIQLTGASTFIIEGTGNYTLSAVIKSIGAATSLRFVAPGAGPTGHLAGITLAGNADNTYTGLTTISSGYVICKKNPGRKAIQGEIILAASSASVPAHLWFQAVNQLNTQKTISFNGAQNLSCLHLNGTVQTILGLVSDSQFARVVNTNDHTTDTGLPPGLTPATRKGELNIGGGVPPSDFAGSILGPPAFPTLLTLKVKTGTQVIQGSSVVAGVTLSTETNGILEFKTTDQEAPTVGSHVIFEGNGTIKKTGPGSLAVESSRILNAGKMAVNGTFVNGKGNEGLNNAYTITTTNGGTETNTTELNLSGTFDLWGGDVILGTLNGNGTVQNTRRHSTANAYSLLTLGQNNSGGDFAGGIKDNAGATQPGSPQFSGVALRKVGLGTQTLRGDNFYTGPTTISSGTLQISSALAPGLSPPGEHYIANTYNGVIAIANVDGVAPAIIDFNGRRGRQVLAGNIISTGTGRTKGIISLTDDESTLSIIGEKDFAGDVIVNEGRLECGGVGPGSSKGSLKHANRVLVRSGGWIGASFGPHEVSGSTCEVANLTLEAGAFLTLFSISGSNMPSVVKVVKPGTSDVGSLTLLGNGFTVYSKNSNPLDAGYILLCDNGLRDALPTPQIQLGQAGQPLPILRWDNTGLYMSLAEGLTCDNCVFRLPDGNERRGTKLASAYILTTPGTTFEGNIYLTGPCRFVVRGQGNYTLSGRIMTSPTGGSGSSGTPVTFDAPEGGAKGLNAGITLSGNESNDYVGSTTIASGYVICNKSPGVQAVSGDLHIEAKRASAATLDFPAHLWFQSDEQLGLDQNGDHKMVIFTDAKSYSYLHLNGTTQTIAGLVAGNGPSTASYAIVDNRLGGAGVNDRPLGMTLGTGPGTLKIKVNATVPPTFSKGVIRKDNPATEESPDLTVRVELGHQIIQPFNNTMEGVTFISGEDLFSAGQQATSDGPQATLEFTEPFNTNIVQYKGVTIKGNGIIKKSGAGEMEIINNSKILKSGGKIWVAGGTFTCGTGTTYTLDEDIKNTASLQVDVPGSGAHQPVFHVNGEGNNPVFGELTGGGVLKNKASLVASASGHEEITIGQNNLSASFSGIIRDNIGEHIVLPNNSRGVSLKKTGTGTQVLTGANIYTGKTTVADGKLKLEGQAHLGKLNGQQSHYYGNLEISNSQDTPPATFEHNGILTQVFAGHLTNNTGEGDVLATFEQSGIGKSIFTSPLASQSFSGKIKVTAGFFGGTATLNNTAEVNVEANGRIGGGYGVSGPTGAGGTLTVSNLRFAATSSKLIVTPRSDNTPSLVEVKVGNAPGGIVASNGFNVEVVGNNMRSGYILKCSNGLEMPVVFPVENITNNTGKVLTLRWDNQGLFMDLGGITCNNCTFSVGNDIKTGIPTLPAVILSDNDLQREFSGNITLNGPCIFAIGGTGVYTFSGQIKRDPDSFTPIPGQDYDLKLSAPSAGGSGGANAGIFFSGTLPNDYPGATIIEGGFIACDKTPGVGVVAIKGNITLKTTTAGCESGLWFNDKDQLSGTGVLTFETAANANARLALNGTTQKLLGINAPNPNCIIENYEPDLISETYVKHGKKGILTLTGTGTPVYTIWGGTGIRGGDITSGKGLEIKIEGTAQKIIVPNGSISPTDPSPMKDFTFNVSENVSDDSILELIATNTIPFSTPASLIFKGAGTLLKTGTGTIRVHKLVTAGNIKVSGGILDMRGDAQLGDGAPHYQGTLEIEAEGTFEHNINLLPAEGSTNVITGAEFHGPITGAGILRRSLPGKTLISGVGRKAFTGTVRSEGGFIGGYGDISNANFVVDGSGKIGGGLGEATLGGVFTVGNLTFASAEAGLLVTARSDAETANLPSLVTVLATGTNTPGTVTVNGNSIHITMDGLNMISGYVLKCAMPGFPDRVPFLIEKIEPVNLIGKQATFEWRAEGLWLNLRGGLSCDNCAWLQDSEVKTGTPGNPLIISSTPNIPITYQINLRNIQGKPCNFRITDADTYTISGVITGNAPVIFNALKAGVSGHDSGFILNGDATNTYQGETTIASGFVICNKSNGAKAISDNVKVAAGTTAIPAHLWFQADNQLGINDLGNFPVIDFKGAKSNSYFHLNGTTQNAAGLTADNDKAFVDNHLGVEGSDKPVELQLKSLPGVLELNAPNFNEPDASVFQGGTIRRGGTHDLTVNVKTGIQIIQNTDATISQVTLASEAQAKLIFNNLVLSKFGPSVILKGAGIIKKKGIGTMELADASVLKTEGDIWVANGVLQNGPNTRYETESGTETNKAILQLEAEATGENVTPVFNLWGHNARFGGLKGGGWVQNRVTSEESPFAGGGYNELIIDQNLAIASPFGGVIRDNALNAAVGVGVGGVKIKKTGTGTQVLTGENRYTGSTTVSSGILKLEGNGQLGMKREENGQLVPGIYSGLLEISNVATGATPATFEHGGSLNQVFEGEITATGDGAVPGTFRQSGTGKSLINGPDPKAFSGNVSITGGFFGGDGNLKNAASVTVDDSGSIGGGKGVLPLGGGGGTLTVSGLTFTSSASKLLVSSMTGYKPSVVRVNVRGEDLPGKGTITADNGFTVVVSENMVSGYILQCLNTIPLDKIIITNNTLKLASVVWKEHGLYLNLGGLTCNNCTFTSPINGQVVTGTQDRPALILSDGEVREFSGPIELKGGCDFLISGTGDYILSGPVSGIGPLTYKALNASNQLLDAGITLKGAANTYVGLTTISSGYVVCNKGDGVVSVPGDITVSASGNTNEASAHLWCQSNDQLDGALIDFTGASRGSWLHLNGTTQNIGGLVANTTSTRVVNHDSGSRPVGVPEVSTRAAILNIEAGTNNYIYMNGLISKGAGAPPLTINVKSGTQILKNDAHLTASDLTLMSEREAAVEINNHSSIYNLSGMALQGDGIIKKSGDGIVIMRNNTLLKTGGKIRVTEATLQNFSDNIYTQGTETNKAVLEVEAPNATNHNPTFDLWDSHVIFGGLSGGGVVCNNWSPGTEVLSGGGYRNLILNQNNPLITPDFSGKISDNAANEQVLEGTSGGINLKKEGGGTQILSGENIYTGTTTVSGGTLKLKGTGGLGKINGGFFEWLYDGTLEISDLPDGNPATFEHNGDTTQVLAGPVSTSGGGSVKGTLLQSGRGKTIITGMKTFTGHVSVTGGFLGGTGGFSSASVTVEAEGSIGGGDGTTDNGAIFTVSALSFAAPSAKLVVTSKSATDHTPSLVEVKNSADAPGPVTIHTDGFTVDAAGDDLVTGYIIKCSNGVDSNGVRQPLPALLANNTGKTICFTWDSNGLLMEIREGVTLALKEAGLVCPRGTDPQNAPIAFKLNYGGPDDYIPQGANFDFSLSDDRAKGNNAIAQKREGDDITASFDGANPTAADLLYRMRLKYNYDNKVCYVEKGEKINPLPTISVNGEGALCTGKSFVLQAHGNGPLTIDPDEKDREKATLTPNEAPPYSYTATSQATGKIKFFATDGDGCKSAYFDPLVEATPVVLTDVPSRKVCMGDEVILTANISGASYQWWQDRRQITGAISDSFKVPTETESSVAFTYAVTITNGCGNIVTDVEKVHVTPEAYFGNSRAWLEPPIAEVGAPVSFKYSSNKPAVRVEYLWDFGDKTFTPFIQNTGHMYFKPGNYKPTLKVTKPEQEACTKTFDKLALEVRGKEVVPYTGDPNSPDGLSVFPIPAQDQLTIVSDTDLQNITIRDISGKAVWSEAANGRQATLSVAHLAKGIYLLTVTDANGVRHLKITRN